MLFRGQRHTLDYADVAVGRIVGYVNSDHAAAFDAWFDASLAVIQVPLDDHVWNIDSSRVVHSEALQCVRDIIGGWNMVFTHNHVARCIFLPRGGAGNTVYDDMTEADQAVVVERAKSIAARVKAIIATFHSLPRKKFDRSKESIYGFLHQLAAMIHCRLTEYKVPVDFEALLKLEGFPALCHRSVAVPLAEGTIKKGSILNSQEAYRAIIAVTRRR